MRTMNSYFFCVFLVAMTMSSACLIAKTLCKYVHLGHHKYHLLTCSLKSVHVSGECAVTGVLGTRYRIRRVSHQG